MKKDPVCKMEVEESSAVTAEYDGNTYYFCSTGCRGLFLDKKNSKNPVTGLELIHSHYISSGYAGLGSLRDTTYV